MNYLLSEILGELEFEYKINKDKTLSLIDLQGANLGNVEQETFEINENLATVILDRLEIYLDDYYINGYRNTLQYELKENTSISDNYEQILEKMKKHKETFGEDAIKLMTVLINPKMLVSTIDIVSKVQKIDYVAMKEMQEKRFNEFVEKSMFFAFSNEQFDKGMKSLGLDPKNDLDKIAKTCGGGFILEKNVLQYEILNDLFEFEQNYLIEQDKKENTDFIYSMFLYELRNYEFIITCDTEDALNALGFTLEQVKKDEKLYAQLIRAKHTIYMEDEV